MVGDVVLVRSVAEQLPSPARIARHESVEQIRAVSQRATSVASAEQYADSGGLAVESTAVARGDALQVEPAVVVRSARSIDRTAESRPLAAQIERDLGDPIRTHGSIGISALGQELVRQEYALESLHQRKVARAPRLSLQYDWSVIT